MSSYYRSSSGSRGFRSSYRGSGGSPRGRGSYRGRFNSMRGGGSDRGGSRDYRNDFSERSGPSKFGPSFGENNRENWFSRENGSPSRVSRDSNYSSRDKYSGRHERDGSSSDRRYKMSDSSMYGSGHDRDSRRMSHDESDRKRMRTDVQLFHRREASPHKSSSRSSFNNTSSSMAEHGNRFKSYLSESQNDYNRQSTSSTSRGDFSSSRDDYPTFKEPRHLPPLSSGRYIRRGSFNRGAGRGISRPYRGRSNMMSSRIFSKPTSAFFNRNSRVGRFESRSSLLAMRKAKMMQILRKRSGQNEVNDRSSGKKRNRSEQLSSDMDEEDEVSDEDDDRKNTNDEAEEEGDDEKKEYSKKLGIKNSEKAKNAKDQEDAEKEDNDLEQDDGEHGDENSPPISKIKLIKNRIPLKCIHCRAEYDTFQRYSYHLSSSQHKSTMSRVMVSLKKKLIQMRIKQRQEQRDLDDPSDEMPTSFCPVCKLNYKQAKYEHYMSNSHTIMAEFLAPFCKICHCKFSSPLLYENHKCSIAHLKQKASVDPDGELEDNPEDIGGDQFMVLDSVGSADENSASGDDEITGGKDESVENIDSDAAVAGINKDGSDKDKLKNLHMLGLEHIKKLQVYYCQLCKACMPYHSNRSQEDILDSHLRGRYHLKRYIPKKMAKARLAKKKIKKPTSAKKIKSVKVEPFDGETGAENVKVKNEPCDEDNASEDGDASAPAEDQTDRTSDEDNEMVDDEEDEDEDKSSDRYDKFRNSEKEIEKKSEISDAKESK